MRVALYARVSTEEQSLHGLSIDAQLAALREWAKDKTVVDEYIDPGISARKPISKRPDIQRLLRDVEAGKIDVVAFTKLDRWTRNIREYYKAQDVLDAHNVAWRALHEDYETETAAGRLKVNIMLAVAQDEADRTSERVKAVFEEKRKKGLLTNGRVPPGLDCKNGVVYPNADADKVKELFSAYIAGRSLTSLCADGLGRPYSMRGIKQILRNEKYLSAGVIDTDTWDKVQTILAQRGTRTVRTDRVYLFSGLLLCPVCGHKLTVRTRLWNGREYVYYRCDHHLKGNRCTWTGTVKEPELEDYLLKKILPAVDGYNLKISKAKKKKTDPAPIQKKLDKLTDLYLSDLISRKDYEKRSEPLRDALKSVLNTPRAIESDYIASAVSVYPSLSKTAQKAFWSALLKSIVPTEDGFDFAFFKP